MGWCCTGSIALPGSVACVWWGELMVSGVGVMHVFDSVWWSCSACVEGVACSVSWQRARRHLQPYPKASASTVWSSTSSLADDIGGNCGNGLPMLLLRGVLGATSVCVLWLLRACAPFSMCALKCDDACCIIDMVLAALSLRAHKHSHGHHWCNENPQPKQHFNA